MWYRDNDTDEIVSEETAYDAMMENVDGEAWDIFFEEKDICTYDLFNRMARAVDPLRIDRKEKSLEEVYENLLCEFSNWVLEGLRNCEYDEFTPLEDWELEELEEELGTVEEN